MKNKKELTYGRAVFLGIATESVLIAVQYILLGFYKSGNPAAPLSFSTEYMMSRGFYFFLIPGFILFATVVFFIMRKYVISSVAYLFLFILAAATIEVGFYLSIAASYQGAFVYSILDKVVGAGLGAIGYLSVGTPEKVA